MTKDVKWEPPKELTFRHAWISDEKGAIGEISSQESEDSVPVKLSIDKKGMFTMEFIDAD